MYGSTLVISFTLLSVISHQAVNAQGYTAVEVNDLKKHLMDGYNKNTNPGGSERINVTVEFSIRNIHDLNERLQKLTTVLRLIITWKDPFMSWSPDNFSDIYFLFMGREEVWVPEFFVDNQHYQIDHGIEENRYKGILYYNNGAARFQQMATAETTCDLDTSGFPFDEHICKITFVCNKDGVNLASIFNDHITDILEPDGSWDVLNATIENLFYGINVVITLGRKPAFILVNLIVPMALLALISPLVFLLPNQSGERVGFSITVLLAISVFMTIVADNVPAKSKPFPLILTMLFTLYSLMIAVVVVVIINARVHRLPDSTPIPRPLIWLLKITRRICCCFRKRNVGKKNMDEDGDSQEKMTLGDEELKTREVIAVADWTWKDISWGVDMFFMTLMYTVKIILIVVLMVMLKCRHSDLS